MILLKTIAHGWKGFLALFFFLHWKLRIEREDFALNEVNCIDFE